MKRYLFILLFCHSIILVSGCATKLVVVDKPLTELIQPETSPQRAASLRLTEEGKAYLQSGNLIKASEALEKAITIDTSNPYAYYYFARHQIDKAVADYRQCILLDPAYEKKILDFLNSLTGSTNSDTRHKAGEILSRLRKTGSIITK